MFTQCKFQSKKTHLVLTWFKIPIKLIPINLKWLIAMINCNDWLQQTHLHLIDHKIQLNSNALSHILYKTYIISLNGFLMNQNVGSILVDYCV